MENRFNFYKDRSFGDHIKDTLVFLQKNLKELLLPLIAIGVPFLLLGGIAYFYIYGPPMEELLDERTIQRVVRSPKRMNEWMLSLYTVFIMQALFYVIGDFLIMAVTFQFIKLKSANMGAPVSMKDITSGLKRNFGVILGTSFLNSILVSIGFAFCFIPGLYLAYMLGITLIMRLEENIGYSEALKRSWKLMNRNGNWWFTFGFMIVLSIIIGVVSYVFSFPVGLMKQAGGWITEGSFTSSSAFYLYVVLNTAIYIAVHLLNVVRHTGFSIRYYSIVEKEEGVGAARNLEQLGKKEEYDPFAQEDEQY